MQSNFKKVIYSGSQEASIASILAKTSDVAAISEINFESLKAKGIINDQDLNVIHASPDIPGAPLVYSRDLPADIKTKIKNAVINAHKHGEVSGYGEKIVKYESQSNNSFVVFWVFFSYN